MSNKSLCFMSLQALVGAFFLFSLSACVHTYKLAPSEVPQGKEQKSHKQVTRENVRSARVYDQWETRAIFDVLWVSDDAHRAYADLYCARRGEEGNRALYDQLVAKGLKENKEKATFYVLADVRDRMHKELNNKDAAWKMHLDINGKKVAPIKNSIKEVEMKPELRSFFGYKYKQTKFRTAYIVEFPAKKLTGVPFKLVLSSVARSCELGWQGAEEVCVKEVRRTKDKERKLIDEDLYWG